MYSLNRRLLTAVSLLLVVFFGLTGLVLDAAFKSAGLRAFKDVLDARVITLLAAAEPVAGHALRLPDTLPEARYGHPGSGLYARVSDVSGQVLWRSASSVGADIDFGMPPPAPGERRFHETRSPDGARLLAYSYGIEWEFDDGTLERFAFSVAESMESYRAQVRRFRQQLSGWFLLLALLLLFCQAALLRWGLKPVRRIAAEIEAVEQGSRQELGEGYPRELDGVRRNMNGLIASQRARLKRYRDALGDLAHSLKTPLAVLGSQLEEGTGSDRGLMRRQVERMNELVSYQLKRAAAAGASVLGDEPVPVGPALGELVLALKKVYADKRVRIAVEADPAAVFHGDRGDLLEIAGNLLDNACKWCRAQVRVRAAVVEPRRRQGRAGLTLIVDDDGPGIAAGQAERLLRRGVRADERVEGQGIGLAVANEIVAGYGGTLSLEAAPSGGARARILLPPPGA